MSHSDGDTAQHGLLGAWASAGLSHAPPLQWLTHPCAGAGGDCKHCLLGTTMFQRGRSEFVKVGRKETFWGTSHQGGYSHDAVVYALQKCGIRHIDTAKRYGCESLLQKAIKESDVKREDLWITTKLWHSDYGYENTKQACLESCKRLGVQYLDLYLVHWPDAQVPGKSNREVRAETWRAMEDLYEKGICRSIGVSNFLIGHLEQLKEDCKITPHVNQAEYHPFQRPQELVDYCRSRNIVFEGYCPLAKGEALTHPNIIQLAKKYGKTPAQICIRWSIQNGIVTIPKSTKVERIRENCEVFDFSLGEEDLEFLNSLNVNKKLVHLTYPLWKG
ncbi:glyoxal reductase-like isoform X2 [Emydura macquarii macquarii]|uniref:glyoxal reductase-like isoform X2 n=1 Tax=Emydura macquarii macquarii TaxID=1129001 RepID=UPI00352B2EAB